MGETYILDALSTITGTSGMDGFYFGSHIGGMTFVVNGTVKTAAATRAAIINNADGNTVVISATGKTEGDFGVENYSGTLAVTNHGFIQANNFGFLLHGNAADIFNDGHVVSGMYGVGMDNFNQDDFDLGTTPSATEVSFPARLRRSIHLPPARSSSSARRAKPLRQGSPSAIPAPVRPRSKISG